MLEHAMTEQSEASNVTASSVVRRGDAVAHVILDGEAVLVHESTGTLHRLDPVATVVWECLDGEASIAVLAAELAEAFGADRVQVETDVLALCRRLAAGGVVDGEGLPASATVATDAERADVATADSDASSGQPAADDAGTEVAAGDERSPRFPPIPPDG